MRRPETKHRIHFQTPHSRSSGDDSLAIAENSISAAAPNPLRPAGYSSNGSGVDLLSVKFGSTSSPSTAPTHSYRHASSVVVLNPSSTRRLEGLFPSTATALVDPSRPLADSTNEASRTGVHSHADTVHSAFIILSISSVLSYFGCVPSRQYVYSLCYPQQHRCCALLLVWPRGAAGSVPATYDPSNTN